MRFRKDHIELSKSFPFDCFLAEGSVESEPSLHFHDCLEINRIEDGGGFNLIEGVSHPLHRGDIYVINNLDRHMGLSDGTLKMRVVVFDPRLIWQGGVIDQDYLRPFFIQKERYSNRIVAGDAEYAAVDGLITKLVEEWEARREGYRMFIKAYLMELLAVLYRRCLGSGDRSVESLEFHAAFDRIRRSVDYIHEHYDTRLSLDLLASISRMNRTYFSTYFKKALGEGVSIYIERIRIEKAMILLGTSNISITECCFSCGFQSLSNFNRVFKKILGTTPKEYRNPIPIDHKARSMSY